MTTNELKGKKVIVLGGTSGIGIATARAAAGRGAEVIVTSRNAERVERAARAVGGRGETADLTNESDAKALFERVGAVDHLVYTAGDELVLGPVAELDLARARHAFEVRVLGALAAVKHAVPKMNAGGSIVLTHGIAGRRPSAGWTLGSAVCGAMESITRALAVELAPIRVNAVSPGFVRTPLWAPIPETDRETMFREAGRKLLTGRVGEADEIAEVYCLLMTNRFTTGQTIIVDGGGVLV